MASLEKKVDGKFDDWPKLVSEFKKKKIFAFLPGEREYELSTATANLLYRFTRPHFVVQPETWPEVLAVVDHTYALELYGQLTVKCGGHSYTGFSTVDKGILVDMKRMTEVHLEFTKEKKPDVAVIQAGARWGDVYRTLIRDDCRGYVVNGGRCPSVGVGGFILGGGLGPFGRTIGMGSDTMVGATIITLKDGKAVKLDVDEKSDPDLFWALRGGGTSAFGIVTEFRMKICALRNPDKDRGVSACRYTWYPNQSWKQIQYEHIEDAEQRDKEKKRQEEAKSKQDSQLFETMNAFYAAEWPDEMTIDSNWMLDMNGDKGKLGIRFGIYYDGPDRECDKLFKKYIVDKDLSCEFQRRTIPEPSTRFLHETLFLMWEEEARLALPRIAENSYQLWCSFVFTCDVKKVGDVENMQEVIKLAKNEQDIFETNFKNDNASLWVTFIHSGGQVSNKGNNSTSAYPWREGVFQTSVLVKWGEKWLEGRAREAILRIKQILSPRSLHMEEHCASYVNFSDATLTVKGDPHKAYYGPNHARLMALKKERDPKNHFKWPWETDTQKWRELPVSTAQEVDTVSAQQTEPTSLNGLTLKEQAKFWTDSIAGKDWSTYSLPPPSYTDLYEPPYVHGY